MGGSAPCQDGSADERRQRYGEDDADAAGHAADDLDGHVGRTDQLVRAQPQRVEVDDEGEAAAEERQYQRIGHRTDHIASDVHAGAP